MTMERKSFPFEVKDISTTGEFAGYLSVFEVVDSYREMVMPGAFAETLAEWATKKRLPPILWQHRSGEPIGPFRVMREDTKGLYVEGKLLVDDLQRAKEAHVLLKEKVISGMSIGFETIGEEIDKQNRLRKLTKVKLWEGSIVTFPANEAAEVEAVKSILRGGDLPSLPEFERHLCEAGFSRTQAKAIACRGLSHLLKCEASGTGEEGGEDPLATLATLKSITLT